MTRIAPLTAPYPATMARALERLTPEGGEAPMLFRVIGTSQRAWDKFTGGSLLDKGPLSMRARELVIFRTAAKVGADYEWGMHEAIYAERCAIDAAQLEALARGAADNSGWDEPEAALIATVDALIDRHRLTDAEHARLARHYSSDEQLEIVQLIGFYQGLSLLIGAFAIPPEPGTHHIPR